MDAKDIAAKLELGGKDSVGPVAQVSTPPNVDGRPVAAWTAYEDGLVADDAGDDTDAVTNKDGDEPQDEGGDDDEDDADDEEDDDEEDEDEEDDDTTERDDTAR